MWQTPRGHVKGGMGKQRKEKGNINREKGRTILQFLLSCWIADVKGSSNDLVLTFIIHAMVQDPDSLGSLTYC